MIEQYVTLFDSLFLAQGLALHISMERHLKNYTLWILCMDDEAHEVLAKLNLPNVRLLQLSKLETEELLQVKPTRTKGEYCWTLTPFAPRFVFERDPSVKRATYLDADLWFRKHPAPIFEEFEATGKHVLITDHAYAPEYDQSATSGQYCVQFMTFTRDGGQEVRRWWQERCIEWCSARYEDGKFGDQKYLDDWPQRFRKCVHVLGNKELLLAPWNASRFPYGNSVAYHFHGLKIATRTKIVHTSSIFDIPYLVQQEIYNPYIQDIGNSIRALENIGVTVKTRPHSIFAPALNHIKHSIKKTISKYYPVSEISNFKGK